MSSDNKIDILLDEFNKARSANSEEIRSPLFEANRLNTIEKLAIAFVDYYNLNNPKSHTLMLTKSPT